jgi:ParB family transcriptional regulator, chromosome partitioning protein
MVRRHSAPLAMIHEIERLKSQGYNHSDIARKLDLQRTMVVNLIALKEAGEERLLEAALSGKMPLGVAMDIAKAAGPELQRELRKAYESGQLNQFSIRVVKRILDQRRFFGKKLGRNGRKQTKSRPSAESLVTAYRRESDKQRLLIKKAKICDARLLFTVTAFNKLLGDENFVTLLRAEKLNTLPKSLSLKLNGKAKELR